MAIFHEDLTPSNGGMHNPQGHSDQGAMILVAANSTAFLWQDASANRVLQINTVLNEITWGPGASDIFDWTINAKKFDIAIADNTPDAFIVKERASGLRYFDVTTLNTQPDIFIGNATNDPRVTWLTGGPWRDSTLSQGTAGDVWTSNAGVAPSWQAAGGGGAHSVTGDGNVIIGNSATSRAWLTANMTANTLVVGQSTDDVDLVIAGESRLEWEAFQPILLGRIPVSVPTSERTIIIGNRMTGSAAGADSTGMGDQVRLDGTQSSCFGADTRGGINDAIIGFSSTSTGSNNTIAGSLGVYTGSFNSGLGTSQVDNGRSNIILLGRQAQGGALDNKMYCGSTSAPISGIVFGTGGNGDLVDATVRELTPAPKITTVNIGGALRVSGGGSTGNGATFVEVYGALANQGAGATQRAAVELIGWIGDSAADELIQDTAIRSFRQTLRDADITSWQLRQGTTDYITADTTNNAENIRIGETGISTAPFLFVTGTSPDPRLHLRTQAATQDCFMRWDLGVGQQTFVAGIDDSDADAFVMSEGNTIGANNFMRVATNLITVGDALQSIPTELVSGVIIKEHAQSGAPTADSFWNRQTGNASTADATATTAITVSPNNNSRGMMEVWIGSNDTTNNQGGGQKALIAWSVQAGTMAHSITQATKEGAAALGANLITAVNSAASLLLQVNGAAATNVEWTVRVLWSSIAGS